MEPKTANLSTCSYGDTKGRIYDYAVLPWGALEPHNYHLPYATDVLLSHALSLEAVEKAADDWNVSGGVFPPVWLGSQNPGQWDLPFCIHARYETQKALLGDVVASLYRQGFRCLFIVNGHGGNSFKNMVRDLAFDYPDFTVVAVSWFTILPHDDYFEEPGEHADEMETSLMMHYHPEHVRMEMAGEGREKPFAARSLKEKVGWMPRNWTKISDDTGVGNPMKSSAEKGKRYAGDLVAKLSLLFTEVAKGDIYI
ncbi:MAG: creatininase family protein [Tannerellaceae bacterium]|jgi:creatinine amidohydrolase|nr:creatininase family protein [Tannerellaceae bacterium]